ncbi:CopD family protein [Andreprevotia chitinilytica]|uniref:CopD family protein n=1 Tax=Andreprevotia chitinilytica TaxID=396808 RepID=UPI000557F02D|nr:CopD family protein [Andreprevotia chitinilytica]
MNLEPLFRFLHIASVTVWVGGMFFAYMCLRPAAGEVLEAPQRLRLWRRVFARFFVWVWGAVILIPLSGGGILGHVGFAAAPLNWHLMLGSGLVMIAIFIYVVTGPYAALGRAVDTEDWKAGGAALNRIRQAVGLNLILGFVTIALATLGRWLT